MDTTVSTGCEAVSARYRPTEVLRELLALRQADPLASPTLARLIGRQGAFLEGVRSGYRYVAAHAGDAGSPLAWHREMRRRLDPTATPVAAPQASGTPRDVIEFNGYRLTHALAVACEVTSVLGPGYRSPRRVEAWRWVFATSSYAMVLAAALGCGEDDAFAGAFLSGTGALLFHAETGPADGGGPIEFARELAGRWQLPEPVRDAFAPDAPGGSVPDLVRRASAAAARHGFADPLGTAPPPDRAPASEPALDAYLEEAGGFGTIAAGVGAMMAIARIAVD